jgi:hypothetical protein
MPDAASVPNSSASTSVAPTAPSNPTHHKKKRFVPLIGPEVEASRFLSSKTRNRFGSSAFSIGPGWGSIRPSLDGKFGADLSLTSTSKTLGGNKNSLFAVSAGPEFRRAYVPAGTLRRIRAARQRAREQEKSGGQDTSGRRMAPPPVLPYYGASVDALYAKVKVPGEGIDGSGPGVGGSVFAGLAFKSRAFVELRLRETTSVKSYNFSRAGLTFGLRF